MPSVGTRRSTRVFVRKNVTKRLSLYKPVGNQVVGDGDGSSYEWMELFGSSGESEDADWWRGRRSGYMSRKGSKEGLKKCRYHAEEGLERGDVSLEDMPSKFLLQEDSGISFPNGKLKFFDMQNGMLKVDVRVKVHPIHESREFEALSDKALDSPLTESGAEEYASPVSQKRRRFDAKNSIKRMKEPKTAFAEAKQNVDGLSCSTNILVIEADRCWREDGAKVVLELSSSSEWCIVVKLGDSTRFMHKAQEMKPSSSNRFTHATIWTGENGWKLEFYDKNDWNVFKELHKECIERNLQGIPTRIVPVPGVREVPGYEESCPSHFARPDSYIHVENDEVDRVLMSESASYDMDSGDEEWLERLNTSLSCGDVDRSSLISKDDFEKIISAFEKAAYSHPDDVSDQGAAAALCSQFGNLRTVGDVYDYWMKKRRQKHSALIRVFQGQPPRKRQPTQKPLLRKKRSFKRQGSHAGRGNLDIFFEAAAKQEAVQRFQAAEAATGRYVDAAVRLRSRAQELMMNADLAIYKAAMALRIAEEIKESASPDLSILSSPEASQGQLITGLERRAMAMSHRVSDSGKLALFSSSNSGLEAVIFVKVDDDYLNRQRPKTSMQGAPVLWVKSSVRSEKLKFRGIWPKMPKEEVSMSTSCSFNGCTCNSAPLKGGMGTSPVPEWQSEKLLSVQKVNSELLE
ncbi:unnamed protein product [Spirodela intermedia]|uniref:Enhancer of polycomb-like protein n=1 Tax=Spirodela intermedia TaxID=51605 RepID=A0A7I8JTT9_SPIIN|nr:unnamed protein product [Spirodela intermedia]CAA6673588.1 unnamed protein product [Spirodela intermedia]